MFTGGRHRHPSLVRGPVNSSSSHECFWITDLRHSQTHHSTGQYFPLCWLKQHSGILLLSRPVNDKASISSNQTDIGSSPRTDKARASSETPALSFHRRSKNFVKWQVVQSTSNFLLYSALKSFRTQMLQGNKSSEEWPYISPTMVLPCNEERQIACDIG